MELELKRAGLWTRIKRKIVHWLGGKTNEEMGLDRISIGRSWQDDKYLFDFKPMFTAPSGSNDGMFLIDGAGVVQPGIENEDKKVQKISLTPKQALDELERTPTNFALTNLDDKIAMLKEKENLIRDHYTGREVKALLERLQNRKKYAEHKEFFDKFDNTTQEKIDALLEKTGLVMKTSDIFIPEFPDEAINVMKAYTEKVELISGKKPIYYVIAEAKEFRSAYEKRDPILLVQSPFGFYYQILGAWDEEMLLLSEL
jgi:hypothetical protein